MDAVNGQPNLGVITILSGQQAGHTFPIYKPITTIGRDKTNDIVIEDDYISRFHAALIWQNGIWTIKNNTAAHNKVTVNQQEVHQAMLHVGDVIGLGRGPFTSFRLQAVTQAPVDNDEDQTGKIPAVQPVKGNSPQPHAQPIQPIQPIQPGQ
ncbi:MAG TPA: FHA domain-containing protein, partial [Ktedonobacteraceae bacterium]|nr:FHA domain-containing protein [Ktedonobacteraceae bacterium]